MYTNQGKNLHPIEKALKIESPLLFSETTTHPSSIMLLISSPHIWLRSPN